MLAFALSFDEVIVTTFTAGQQTTLPIWMYQELIRPRDRPVPTWLPLSSSPSPRSDPACLLPDPRWQRRRALITKEGYS